jgi:hypothetical protein
MKRRAIFAGITLVALSACICLAQMQANQQMNMRVAGTGADNTLRYANVETSRMMPSELRYEYWKSGLLPSEIRANYLRLGPMSTQGQSAYFKRPENGGSQSTFQDSRVDMMVRPKLPSTPVPAPTARPTPSRSAPAVGSVRYSNAVPSSQLKPIAAHNASRQVGSVRYDSRVR